MASSPSSSPPDGGSPRFLSVADVARIFGVSEVTVYRDIRGGRFPAVKIRGRYVVPARAIAAMEDAAVESGRLVDATDWVAAGPPQDGLPPADIERRRPTGLPRALGARAEVTA
jgi:excisionase family DNA binding protein